MKIWFRVLVPFFFLFVVVSFHSCKKDREDIEAPVIVRDSTLIEKLIAASLEGKVIPHRINTKEHLIEIQNEGFRVWELDLVFYSTGTENYFLVQHGADTSISISLYDYLSIANMDKVIKLWFDVKNLNDSNLYAALNRLNFLDSTFDISRRIILESKIKNPELKIFRKYNWHTSYYIPYEQIEDWIDNNDTIAQYNYGQILSNQLLMQDIAAVSFDVTCYSFVKKYLEPYISYNLVYHSWDMTLSLKEKDFIRNYFEKDYSDDNRVKTVIIPYH